MADDPRKIEIRKGRRTLVHLEGRVRAGKSAVTWNGRRNRPRRSHRRRRARVLATGRYTIVLTITSADGQQATDTARLTIKRKRR